MRDRQSFEPAAATAEQGFLYKVLVVFFFVVLGALLLQTLSVIPLVFGAILVALLFRSLAEPLARRTGLHDGIALMGAVLLVFGLLAGAAWLLGDAVRTQVQILSQAVPAAWEAVEVRLEDWGLSDQLEDMVADVTPTGSGLLSSIGGAAMSFGSGLADLLLIVVGGVYLAAQPKLYRAGLLKLITPARRNLAAEALDDSGRALRLWLLGQLASMAIIGTVTGIGLWLIGVPSALTLGILAGPLEFVAIIGPIIAAIPALLIALTQGLDTASWTLALYVVVQQLESNLVQPIVQQKAVEMPPALLLFSIVIGGLLFGLIGVLLAAPMTVLAYVLVKRLYVGEALDTPTSIPGNRSPDAD
jgi:predicted PurR-regulated permease PerM